MLKHEASFETQSPPAAQVRVTPEELAAAISRIEARKDVSQRSLDGTIAIGEAIEQLGLEASPEEVLAEVQAGRQKAVTQMKRLSPQQRLRLLMAAGAAIVVLTVGWVSPYFAGNPSDNVQAAQPPETSSVQIQPVTSFIQINPNLLVKEPSGKLVMLSEVGDNRLFNCTFDGNQFSQYSPENAAALWTLIKHNGKVYVRGRMLKMSPKVFSLNGADVTSVDNDPQFSVPVTLPIDGFRVTPNTGSNVEFHAQNIHLDSHANEKWQP